MLSFSAAKRILSYLFAAVGLLQLLACSATTGPQKRYFWPPFSDTPKIEYIEFFNADIDVTKHALNPVVDAIFGRERPQPLFHNPFAVYSNGKGRFYVTETGRRYVLSVDLNRGRIDHLKDDTGGLPVLRLPTGIDGDRQGNVYVVDSLARKILIFDANDQMQKEWFLESLQRPLALAIDDERGRVYVVDADRHKVFVLGLADGKVLSSFGHRGTGPGEFNYPLDLDLDADGNLYVLDSMNARVQVFSPAGDFLRAFGERGTAAGSFQIPKGLAVTPAGQVYVTDAQAHRLVVFSLEGEFLMNLGGKFVADNGQVAPGGFYLPGDVAADATNGIWVVDGMNRMIHHFQYLDDEYLRKHPVMPGQAVVPVLK